jgi:hypothetical protein
VRSCSPLVRRRSLFLPLSARRVITSVVTAALVAVAPSRKLDISPESTYVAGHARRPHLYGTYKRAKATTTSASTRRPSSLATPGRCAPSSLAPCCTVGLSATTRPSLTSTTAAPRAECCVAFGNQDWYLIQTKQIDHVRAVTRRAVEFDFGSYSWPMNLGHTYLLTAQPDSAYALYETALARMASEEDRQGATADFDLLIEREWAAEPARGRRRRCRRPSRRRTRWPGSPRPSPARRSLPARPSARRRSSGAPRRASSPTTACFTSPPRARRAGGAGAFGAGAFPEVHLRR